MIRKFIIATLAMFALSVPAQALTLQQAQDELAGMYCSGSVCTSEETSYSNVETRVVTGSGSPSDNAVLSKECMMQVMGKPDVWVMEPNVDANCTPLSIVDSNNSYTRIDKVGACTVTSKELVYNGPFTSRDTAWSVNTSTATSGGAC